MRNPYRIIHEPECASPCRRQHIGPALVAVKYARCLLVTRWNDADRPYSRGMLVLYAARELAKAPWRLCVGKLWPVHLRGLRAWTC